VVVCGEGRNYLCALIVPAWENVRRELELEAVALPKQSVDFAQVDLPSVRELLRYRIDAALVGLSNAEQVKKFAILPEPFSVAAEELTVSMKLRRGVIVSRYARQIEDLYRE
jgi:long-chain acyl-CoA synthetase